MNKPSYTISQAISCSAELLAMRAEPRMVALALVADGFSNDKALTIVNWAINMVNKQSAEVISSTG